MKILIIKLSSLGDIVHAIPVLHALKQIQKPTIDWLVYENFSPILEGQSSINKIHVLKDKKPGTLIKSIRELKKEHYDLVIDLQGLTKTALIAFALAKRRLGFKQPRELAARIFYSETVDAGKALSNYSHIVDKNLALAKALGVIFNSQVKTVKPQEYKKICLIPSTTWESKLWLIEYWADFIKRFNERYKTAEIFIIGTNKDLDYTDLICKQLGKDFLRLPIKIVTDKKIKELPEFFRSMNLIIGVDTGPLHIAAASCGQGLSSLDPSLEASPTRIIGLYGPTSGARSGPYGYEHISVDELSSKKASHKRKLRQDGHSMRMIKPGMLLGYL
jgi:ADP-heptose:LPS heptosyltransferase